MVTLSQLKTQVRQRADQEHSEFVSDTELTSYINNSYKELYDLLVSSFEDYYVQELEYTADDVGRFSVPDTFYKLLGVDYTLDNGVNYTSLRKWNFIDRNRSQRDNSVRLTGFNTLKYRLMANQVIVLPETQSANKMFKMWFIPKASTLVDDTDTIDDVNGWDEYIIVDAAMKCLIKEESDITALKLAKADLVYRITEMAKNRDAGLPATISNVSRSDGFDDDFDGGWGY